MERKPSLMHKSTEGFSPVKSRLQRMIRELISSARKKKRVRSVSRRIGIPCHVVKRKRKSPLVTATRPAECISRFVRMEYTVIQSERKRLAIIWNSRMEGTA